MAGLDLIPTRWLHLTMQGVGFTDEVSEPEISDIIQAARERVSVLPPVSLGIGPALVDPEAVMLEVRPADALQSVRAGIRAAIANVLGAGEVPDSEHWNPHISLAYSNSNGPAAPFTEAVSAVTNSAINLTVSTVSLITLSRDTHLYQWVTNAAIPLRA
jgi:2'-5' RNA ligase